jgi:hypothetical protein
MLHIMSGLETIGKNSIFSQLFHAEVSEFLPVGSLTNAVVKKLYPFWQPIPDYNFELL